MYDPYLDTDWTQVSPEVSYLLWLTDEELKQKQGDDNAKRSYRRRAERVAGLNGDTPSREISGERFLQNSIGFECA